MTISNDQIKHMVNRFLGWYLPENFRPDAGISFKSTFNDHLPTPMKHNPTGTNLFDAGQAEAMVRYMVEGLASAATVPETLEDDKRLMRAAAEEIRALRRRNEILDAQVSTMELMASFVHATPPVHRAVGMGEDIAWRIDRRLSEVAP